MEAGISESWVNSVLLICCAASFVVVILSTLTTILVLRRNASLVQLLLGESKRHTAVTLAMSEQHSRDILALGERLNNQYYMHQEKVSIEHIATLRELLTTLGPVPSEKQSG